MDLKARLEQEFLPYVIKPARYLGNEFNAVQKKLTDVELRIALCSPSVYEQGIADLSFEILYYVLNSEQTIWTERFFLPSQDACNVLKERRIPLFSLESKTALNEFHIVIFTLHSVFQYTGLTNMLKLGGIPLRNENRADTSPLIIGCGDFTINPEPVADFFDAILFGDWQQQIPDISRKAINVFKKNGTKIELLNELSKLNEVYLPAGYEPVYNDLGEFNSLNKLDESLPGSVDFMKTTNQKNNQSYSIDPLFSVIQPDYSIPDNESQENETFGKEAGINFGISSQFENQCRNLTSPGADILPLFDGVTGHIWSEIKEKFFLANKKLNFSFPEFKIEAKELFSEEIQFLKRGQAHIFAGAGSLRLRTLINRHHRDEDLYRLLSFLIQEEFTKIQLKFLIGLPTEKNEDISQLINIIKKCAEIVNSVNDTQLTIHVSPFIPRPFSIFQWEEMENHQKLQAKYDLIQQNLTGLKINFLFEDIQRKVIEVILGRGDRSLSDVLETVCESITAIPDGEFDFMVWQTALNAKNQNWEKLLEAIPVTEPLPWDHIDYGVSKYHLKSERLNALQGKIDSTISKTVHLGKGMPRDQFENLIKNSILESATETAQADEHVMINEQPEEIQYGRQVRRQVKPATVIKKKVRVHYTKTGSARYFSHLDVARIFEITARKTSIPLVYTQGKSPHPKFSFGPPLPVGITSIAEYLDVEIELKDGTDIQTQLNSVFPEGIQIVQYKILFVKVPALSAVINLADYKINWHDSGVPEKVVSNWMKSEEVWIDSKIRDEIQKINIRPYVEEMQIDDNELYVRTQAVEGKMARITDILDSLKIHGENDPSSFVIQRIGQFVKRDVRVITPFDVV